MLRVKNIGSNMTEVRTKEARILISYETPVAAFIESPGGYVRTSKKWSVTTTKHINKWLNGCHAIETNQSFFDGLLDS